MTFQQLDSWLERRQPRDEPLEPAYLIGLTGPMGCGKTTVGRILGRLGGRIVDADQVSRAILAPDQPVLDDIQARSGEASSPWTAPSTGPRSPTWCSTTRSRCATWRR